MSQKKQGKRKPKASSAGVSFSLIGSSLAAEAPGSIRQPDKRAIPYKQPSNGDAFLNNPCIMPLTECHNLQETLALLYCKLGPCGTLKFMGGVRLIKLQTPDLGFGHPENVSGEDIPSRGLPLCSCPRTGV